MLKYLHETHFVCSYAQSSKQPATERKCKLMSNMFWIGLAGALAALLFAVFQFKKVMAFSEGNDTMKKIAAAIRAGANAYLKHQYTTVAKVFFVVFLILGEVLRVHSAKDRAVEYKGLTPELAAQRLAEEAAAEKE